MKTREILLMSVLQSALKQQTEAIIRFLGPDSGPEQLVDLNRAIANSRKALELFEQEKDPTVTFTIPNGMREIAMTIGQTTITFSHSVPVQEKDTS